MLYWAICGAVAIARLVYVYLAQPNAKGKPREVPWRAVTLTISVLYTCAMMGYINIGGMAAAGVYGVMVLFETPLPRALFMFFMIAVACRSSMHDVIIAAAAGIPDIALALLDISWFN